MKHIYLLLTLLISTFSFGQTTILSENMGNTVSTSTIAIASHTFQNGSPITFSGNADTRTTSASEQYTGASGNRNVFFSTASSAIARDFAIENINALTFTNLTLQFGYRKEQLGSLPNLTFDYWNGTEYVNLPFTFNEAVDATVGWYLSPVIDLPVAAQINGLKLRWVRAEGGATTRIDDVVLKGNATIPVLGVSPVTISNLTYIEGNGPSNSQSFSVTGQNLNGTDVTVSLPMSSNFEISETENGAYGSSITLTAFNGSATTIFARLKSGLTINSYNDTITASGGGASTSPTVTLSGSVNAAIFLIYEFTGEVLTPTQSPSNAVTSNFQLSTGTPTFNSTAAGWSGSNVPVAQSGTWTSTNKETAKNFFYTVTANPGYKINITNISFEWRATAAGPSAITVEINGTEISTVDAPADTTTLYSVPVTFQNENVIEVRIKGWLNGSRTSAGTGIFRIDDVRLDGAVTLREVTTWTGNTNNDWATASNWDNGVPTNIFNATIPDVTNAPIISGSTNVTLNDLSITEPDGLTMNSGGSLIVNGTSTGNVTYNRNLPTTNWYLVSSPVSGQAYNDAYVTSNGIDSGTESNRGIATYTTASNDWAYFQAGGSATFGNGTGYSVKKSSSGDISFTGTINTADVSVTVANSGTGFNLIGNPFTSHLTSNPFLTDNSANLVSQTLWVWNQATSSYDAKVTGDNFVLAPAQGFFVRSSNGTNLNIAKTYQASTGGVFQKSVTSEVVLNMTDGTFNRFARVKYTDKATTGFDNGYDGETFGGIQNSVDIFTHLVSNSEGKKFQVQSLPNSDFETMIVPVGIKAAAGKEITFTAEAMNLPNGINVYLEDKVANTVTLLSDTNATYKVTLSEPLDGIGRFYLHTSASGVLGTDTIVLDNVSVYATNNNTLRVVGISAGNANLKIFNILGKQVMETTFSSTGVQDISLPKLATGMYLIQLETASGKLNKKIVLE